MLRLVTPARLAVVSVALICTVVPATHVVAAPDPLIEGLAGPLGLAVGADGTVYVAEAFGGRLTSIDRRGKVKVFVDAPGQEIAGVDAAGKGTVVYTQTLFDGEPGEEAPPLDAILARVQPNGKSSQIASMQAYEGAANPDGVNTYGLVDPSPECAAQVSPFFGDPTYPGIVESHPYAVAIVPGGYAVADAAGNSVLRVGNNGRVSTVAVLPPVEQTITAETVEQFAREDIDISACENTIFRGEPVPTDVEVGPDGAWYVSSLPGFPEASVPGPFGASTRRQAPYRWSPTASPVPSTSPWTATVRS